MELAILTGHGPPGLLDADGPLVEPGAVALLGHRPPELHPDVAARTRGSTRDLGADRARDPQRGVGAVAREAAGGCGRPAWLHLDLDVLDQAALPAVSYPQTQGLDWDELVALARPLARAPACSGSRLPTSTRTATLIEPTSSRVVDALGAIFG